MNPKAQTKWLYAKPVTAAVAGNFQQMLGMGQARDAHPQVNDNAQTTRDFEAVNRAIGAIANHMINPFTSPSAQLISIANGEIAPKDVLSRLDTCERNWRKCYEEMS